MSELITITRKQWENDMRHAKAEALREIAADYDAGDREEIFMGGEFAAEARRRANELDQQ